MADSVTIKGRIVGLEERPYDFENNQGERIAGTTRKIWIENPDGEPFEIRMSEDFYGQVREGFGKSVVVQADLRASNNKIQRVAQSLGAG
jgi:hypothetical protein